VGHFFASKRSSILITADELIPQQLVIERALIFCFWQPTPTMNSYLSTVSALFSKTAPNSEKRRTGLTRTQKNDRFDSCLLSVVVIVVAAAI